MFLEYLDQNCHTLSDMYNWYRKRGIGPYITGMSRVLNPVIIPIYNDAVAISASQLFTDTKDCIQHTISNI